MIEAKDVIAAALQLPPAERARLLEEVSASLVGIELSPEWKAEIKRRIDDVDSGRVKTVPAEDVFARLERRLRDK